MPAVIQMKNGFLIYSASKTELLKLRSKCASIITILIVVREVKTISYVEPQKGDHPDFVD
ncbi:hypothetical protein M514_18717 [Trichuris suis]|uniref:Uncharacterized protein n=1 Tax=Trichuris suis TaxID=68888 RepID=A0A085NI44_9BILA|nr:hypothetical protein M514_18717 [Trichuris suis]